MGFDNNVTVAGNITRDPELRFTQAGLAIAKFGVAWNRRRPDQEDDVSFFNVVCFRQLAENVSSSLRRGARVVIFGTLQQNNWETQQGERRSTVEIIADDVAPSLKWATAEVTRNERRAPAEGGGYRGGRRTEDSPRPAAGRSQAQGPSTDEEPF